MTRAHRRNRDWPWRLSLPLAALLLACSSTLAAQKSSYPIFTANHLNEAMRTVGLAFGLATSALARNDAENAKDYLIRARDQLATTITFWRDRKKEDAIAILRDTLKKLDDLDTALSVKTVDTAAARSLTNEVRASCESCHAKYREQDPTTKEYRVKPELLK